jgi:hypothetical protein
MKVLIGCEKSRRVASAFEALGHDATSCDILPAEVPGKHIQDDVLKHLDDGWDLGIFHPDCTYLANSGVRWLPNNPERYALMIKACEFFNKCLNANIPLIGVENPIQHKYARQFIRIYDQLIQPWWFGEGETKATCLWLKGLPPLMATYVHTERLQRVHLEPPGPERQANRSRTYLGLANAMAHQWGIMKVK